MSKPHTSSKKTTTAKAKTTAKKTTTSKAKVAAPKKSTLQAKVAAVANRAVAGAKTLPAKAKKTTKRQRMIAAPLVVVAVVGIAFAMLQVTGVTGNPENNGDNNQVVRTQHQQDLLGQVDNVTGAPRDGRDPANQKQTSLAEAANSPTLTGQRKDSTASGVSGGGSASGPSDNNGSYLNSSGCYYNYGNGGQCLAAHVAVNGKTTCNDVRGHGGFPNGIVVSGKDHFNLDTNKNGTACDAGDKA